MAVKLPDTLVPMADFPSAFAKDVQFTDGENLQNKLDKGKLGSSITEEQTNNIEKIPSIEGKVKSNSQAIANKADKEKVEELSSQLDTKAEKEEIQNVQQQINNLVLGAVGDGNNAEVVQARGNEKVLSDRLNNIESGKLIQKIGFSKLTNKDDIIDYSLSHYDKEIVGYDTDTFAPIYGNKEGSFVTTIDVRPYSGTITIPNYPKAEKQAMLLSSNGKVFFNLTYTNLTSQPYDWVSINEDSISINVAKLYKFCWVHRGNKVITEIIVAMDKTNTYAIRKNGVILKNDSLASNISLSSYPFIASASLIKENRNYTSLQKAIKDICIYSQDITHKFFVSYVLVSAKNMQIHISTVEKGGIVLNAPKIEIKDEIQKINLTVQNDSGYSGYIVINSSEIDQDLSNFGWDILDYETSGILPNCIKSDILSLKNDVELIKGNPGNKYEEIDLVIPPKIYGVSGKEIVFYLNNVTLNNLDNYIVRKNKGTGDLKSRNRIVYNIETSGWSDKTVMEIYNLSGNKIKDFEIPFKIVGANANSSITKKCLFLGDSFIASSAITNELYELFKDDAMNIKLLGTKGWTHKHEGRAGWSTYDYIATQSFNNSTNIFLNNGKFDFGYYLTQNSIDTPDWVFIQLGINDNWRPMNNTTTVGNIQTMINSIKSVSKNIKVGVALVCPPYLGKNGVDGKYSQMNRLKQNKKLINAFNKETEGIYIVPINSNLDAIYNFPMEETVVNSRSSETIKECTDTTHPTNGGYPQIADSYYCFLKSN